MAKEARRWLTIMKETGLIESLIKLERGKEQLLVRDELSLEEYQREVQKVTELQDMVIQLRDHIARSSNNDARLSGMKDKIGAANSLNNELRNRVRVLEEINDRKDACIKDWNQTVEVFENELQKTIDDNGKLGQEREIVRNSLQQVLFD